MIKSNLAPNIRRTLPQVAVATLALAASPVMGTEFPLALDNCGFETAIKAPPQRVVTVGQAATEALYGLGLEDRVVGTSVWFTDVPEKYRDINAGIERLADNDPSLESVVAAQPDLVVIQFEWHIGPEGVVGTREQFAELGIPTYVLPADCVGKDNSAGVDGTSTALFSSDTLVTGITELGQIFDVEDRAVAFAAELKAREAAAIASARALDVENLSAAFWYSSPDDGTDPYIAGQLGAPGYIMDTLGIANVAQSNEEWPTISWETIARANPSVIVLADLTRRRFAADDVAVKLEFLRTDPVTSQMDAVKNERFVIMDAHALDRTLRTVDGIEILAKALAGFEFDQ